MRTNRQSRNEESTVDATATEPTADAQATDAPTPDAPATPATDTAKRGPRPALEVGEVTVRKSVRDDLKSRPSPTQNNPVFLAVKAADFDTPTDLVVDKDKVANVAKILRRSAQAELLNVGMTIFPGNPAATDDDGNEIEGKVIVTFQKAKEKKAKGKTAAVSG